MEFHHERFLPDQRVPKHEISSLNRADKLEAGSYYDWTEVSWEWLMASPAERPLLIELFDARVHVNAPNAVYTVELPGRKETAE